MAVLRASQAASRVIEMEREVAAVQERLSAADKRLSRLSDAQARAKEAQNTILRVQGEFVDEQLAELSPLLEEPYQRLRPHIDWQKVRYKLRGDVRRMLSLLVGANLNPSFMFSSGQRRRAGGRPTKTSTKKIPLIAQARPVQAAIRRGRRGCRNRTCRSTA